MHFKKELSTLTEKNTPLAEKLYGVSLASQTAFSRFYLWRREKVFIYFFKSLVRETTMASTTVNHQCGLKYLLIFVMILTTFNCVFEWNWGGPRQIPRGGPNSRLFSSKPRSYSATCLFLICVFLPIQVWVSRTMYGPTVALCPIRV